jgi:hypothetical protein
MKHQHHSLTMIGPMAAIPSTEVPVAVDKAAIKEREGR